MAKAMCTVRPGVHRLRRMPSGATLDPDKICDNCMKCVMGDADYRAISITGIELEEES